jgi:hypothetical protein
MLSRNARLLWATRLALIMQSLRVQDLMKGCHRETFTSQDLTPVSCALEPYVCFSRLGKESDRLRVQARIRE